MKLSALALDYDGTIAQGEQLDPSVRDAIAYARTGGISVLLVTGRILGELGRPGGGRPALRRRCDSREWCCPAFSR